MYMYWPLYCQMFELDEDEWFFQSVKRYKHLYMYDLQYPLTAADWISTACICLATRGRDKNELTELAVPDRLTDDEKSVPSKERDFHVKNGGFSSQEIKAIRSIPNTRLVIASPECDDGHIQVWQLGSENTDLIEVKEMIKNVKSRRSSSLLEVNASGKALFGSHVDNLCCVDTGTYQVIQNSSEMTMNNRLSEIHKIDSNAVCCCLCDGYLMKWDLREKQPLLLNEEINQKPGQDMYWTMDLCGSTVARLSSSGSVSFTDLRNLNQVISKHSIGMCTTRNFPYLTIKLSENVTEFSISGFDENVYIFNNDSKLVHDASAKFIHEGHIKNSCASEELKIVTHLQHPDVNGVILSAGTDGSLHMWQQS